MQRYKRSRVQEDWPPSPGAGYEAARAPLSHTLRLQGLVTQAVLSHFGQFPNPKGELKHWLGLLLSRELEPRAPGSCWRARGLPWDEGGTRPRQVPRRQRVKQLLQESFWEPAGAIPSRVSGRPTKKQADRCRWPVLSYIAYVCFNFKPRVSPRFVTQTYGTRITFCLVFIESTVAVQTAQRCHDVNNIYY